MNKKLFNKLMDNISYQIKRILNEDVENFNPVDYEDDSIVLRDDIIQASGIDNIMKQLNNMTDFYEFRPFKISFTLPIETEEEKREIYNNLDTIPNNYIKVSKYSGYYWAEVKLVNTDMLKQIIEYFADRCNVQRIIADNDNQDNYSIDNKAIETRIAYGRQMFRKMVQKYITKTNDYPSKIAKRCANKLCTRLNGGDYNELMYYLNLKLADDAREYMRAINRDYSKRVFSKEEQDYIINNYNEIVDAINILYN